MRSVRSAIVLVSLVVFSAMLSAQKLIVHEKPVRLRHLAGATVDPTGLTIPYAMIELRDAKDHHMLASTFADANGKFFFADKKHGEQFEIRVSLAGFKIVQYTVSMARIGKEHLRVVLPTAT